MHAIEEMVRSEIKRFEDSDGWFTEDDLLKLYHGKQQLVDKLVAKAKSEPKRIRPHPDFGDDLPQYKAHEKTSVMRATVIERKRTLNWESLVSGETALSMAKNIESLFGFDAADVQGGGAQEKNNPKPHTNKTKLFNPKALCNTWATKSAEWAKLFREFHGQLTTKAPIGNTFPRSAMALYI